MDGVVFRDARAVVANLRIDQGRTMSLLRLDRACFIGGHEFAIANHVSGQYCGKPALDPVLSHVTIPVRVPRG